MKKLSILFGIAMLMLGIFVSNTGHTSAAALKGRVETPGPCIACTTGNVSVVVRGYSPSHTGLTPLANAAVSVYDMYSSGPVASGTTDANGNFSATLQAGNYTVEVAAEGYNGNSYDTTVYVSKTTSVSAVLNATPGVDPIEPGTDPVPGPCFGCGSAR